MVNEPPRSDLAGLEAALRRHEQATRDNTNEMRALRTEIANTYVRKDVYEAEKETTKERFDTVEETLGKHSANFVWIVRLVLAVIVTALLATVIIQAGGRP